MRTNSLASILSFALFTIGICGTMASAQNFPSRPVDMVVSFGPGGGADGMGRMVARILSPLINVPVPASNIAGAAGNTGLTKVANAEAGGYTIGTMTGLTVSSWAAGMGSLTPDDFSYLAIAQSSPSMLFAPVIVSSKIIRTCWITRQPILEKCVWPRLDLGRLMIVKFLGTKGYEMKNVPYAKPAERYISPLGGHTELLYEEPGDVVQFVEGEGGRCVCWWFSVNSGTPVFRCPDFFRVWA